MLIPKVLVSKLFQSTPASILTQMQQCQDASSNGLYTIMGDHFLLLWDIRDSKTSRFDVFESCSQVLERDALLSGRSSSKQESRSHL